MRSIETMQRIVQLGKEIGITRYFAVINKADNPGPVAEKLSEMGIPVLGTIPFDPCLVEADLAGKPPIDADCPSVESIRSIKKKLEEMFGEKK